MNKRSISNKDVIFHTKQLLKQLKKRPNTEKSISKLESIIEDAPFLGGDLNLNHSTQENTIIRKIKKTHGVPEEEIKVAIIKIIKIISKIDSTHYKTWKEYCRSYKRRSINNVKQIEIETSLIKSIEDYIEGYHREKFEDKELKGKKFGKKHLEIGIKALLSDAINYHEAIE